MRVPSMRLGRRMSVRRNDPSCHPERGGTEQRNGQSRANAGTARANADAPTASGDRQCHPAFISTFLVPLGASRASVQKGVGSLPTDLRPFVRVVSVQCQRESAVELFPLFLRERKPAPIGLEGDHLVASRRTRSPDLVGGYPTIVLDLDPADPDIRARDSFDRGQSGEDRAHAMLAAHSGDSGAGDHAGKIMAA